MLFARPAVLESRDSDDLLAATHVEVLERGTLGEGRHILNPLTVADVKDLKADAS